MSLPTTHHTLPDGTPTFLKALPARAKSDLKGADAVIIGVPFMPGVPGQAADLMPDRVRQASLDFPGAYLPEYDLEVFETLRVVDYGDAQIDPSDIPASVVNVETKVMHVLEAGAVPVTLGGGAPCSGYSSACALSRFLDGQPVGAINLGARGDNAGEASDGSNLSSMTWLRHQWRLPGFEARHHVQVGLRGPQHSRASAYSFREHGALLVTGRDLVEREGLGLIRELVERAGDGTRGIWFGIDWDVLDGSEHSGAGLAPPMGMRAAQLLQLAFEIGRHGGLSLSTMSGSQHSSQLPRLVIATVLHFLAGVGVRRGKAEVKPWLQD